MVVPQYRGEWAEGYSLTSHALEALDLIQSLSRERALISESRINTILDAARRWAMEAHHDRAGRIERLEVQISQLVRERDRLANGGELATASDERMLDGYANLVDLIEQLPALEVNAHFTLSETSWASLGHRPGKVCPVGLDE